MPPASPPARAQLAAALRAEASRSTHRMIKIRARTYAARPRDLDAIAPRLSAAAPETLIEVGAALLRAEAGAPRRWFGFGGEVAATNARAILLLGRALRRFAA